MARPTKFTPEVTETILNALKIGATYKDASEAAGVDYMTFRTWMERGEAGKKPFNEFFEAVRKAEAQARLNYLTTIAQAAAKGDWKAAEAYLKRRDRANWGDTVDVTTGGDKITKVTFEYRDTTDEAAQSADTSQEAE